MNLPNKLTILRILLVPFMMIFYMNGAPIIATIIFLVSSFTDMLDGYYARKYGLITNFGKIMDPLADKILVITAFVLLVEQGIVAGWILTVILAREFIVSGLRMVAAAEGIVIAAGISGKIKTVTQMIAIPLLMLNNWPGYLFNLRLDMIFLWICLVMTVISGVEYVYKNRKVFLRDGC